MLEPYIFRVREGIKKRGFAIYYYYLKEENDFELQDDFIDYLDDIDMVFILNPNNPVGKLQIKKRLNILRRLALKGKLCACLTSALWTCRTDIR